MLSSFRECAARIRAIFSGRRDDAEFSDELRGHLELLTEENVRRGMPVEEARRQARIRLGNAAQIRETHRQLTGLPFFETLLQDVRYALRMLRKSPGFAAVAVLTLALGIGANTAIFSAVNGIWLEPLLYAHYSRLVTVDLLSIPAIRAIQKQSDALARTAIYRGGSALVVIGGVPLRVFNSDVSDDFFPLLGIRPLLGRPILPGDTQPGSDRVAVLSYYFWMDDFGADPHVVGRDISVNHAPYKVVGVMPKGFGLGVGLGGDSRGLWIPSAFPLSDRESRGPFSSFVARLKEGVTFAQFQSQLKAIHGRLEVEYPKQYPSNLKGYGWLMTSGINGRTDPTVRLDLLILLGAVGFVLLTSCVNVAALLVARAWTRQTEMAIRRALGATRGRLMRQLLAESLVLAAAGGSLGLFFSVWGIRLVRAMAPPYTPRMDYIRLDGNVLWFTFGISLISALLIGLVPALHESSRRVGGTLKGGMGGSFAGNAMRHTRVFRNALVMVELALAVVVVTGGALMVRSFDKLMHIDTGVQPDHVITMSAQLSYSACNQARLSAKQVEARSAQPRAARQTSKPQKKGQEKESDDQLQATCSELEAANILGGIRSLPAVRQAALALSGPLEGGLIQGFRYPGGPPNPGLWVEGRNGNQLSGEIENRPVSPGFFATLGIRLLKGRDFERRDSNSAVTIVSESFARKYIPGDPIGKRFSISTDTKGRHSWMQIVGEVHDVRDRAVQHRLGTGPVYYTPYAPAASSEEIIVRTSANAVLIVPAVERLVRSVDADAPISNIRTVDQIISNSAAEPRFQTALLVAFGSLGLILAMVGVYGVISYSVAQRTHEIGVRMALGAERQHIARMLIGQASLPVVLGIAAGLGGALGLTRFLRSLLFEIRPADPPTFIGVAVLLTGVAAVACYVPARRAMKVDPMVALRYE